MISNLTSTVLKQKIKRAMRMATPKDTGNLAYNALRVYKTDKGFKTVYLGRIAGYGKILNEMRFVSSTTGNYKRQKKNRHYGWHNKAALNGMYAVGKHFKPSSKFKMYNNKQNSTYVPGDGISRIPANEVKNRWMANTARQKFELTNKNKV